MNLQIAGAGLPRRRFASGTFSRDAALTQREDGARFNLDLQLAKEFSAGRGVQLRISADVFNVLDEQIVQIYNPLRDVDLSVASFNWG